MTHYEAGEWPVLYSGAGCSAFADSGMEEIQERFENIAANLLWNWTNRIFGTYTELVRPCRVTLPYRPSTFEGAGPPAAYWNAGGGWGFLPYVTALGVINLTCGICGTSSCNCDPSLLKAIHLLGPVQEIVEIVIDGVVLTPSAYRIENQRTLIRQDGGVWPSSQDMVKPAGETDTWTIEYKRGIPVPLGGQSSAGLLACELYKAETADASCGLPSRVKTVARQGITVGILDTFEGLDEGKTGIWSIDSWIASVTRPRDFVGITSPDTVGRSRWKI